MLGCLETGPRHEVGEFINDVISQTSSAVSIGNSSEKMVLSVL